MYQRDRPVDNRGKPPHPSSPLIRCKPIHRSAQTLYKESFYDVTLDTGTKYPCTQNELNASGGANRRAPFDASRFKDKSKWFAHPNNGPFVDARIAAREVFDHNDLNRTPSASEDEAIHRLQTGLVRAANEGWGPDLAIKVFCDLDKVFFCGRLRGHVILTWTSGDARSEDNLGITIYIGKGKCVIEMNAKTIFSSSRPEAQFFCMFAILLHEMSHAYSYVRALSRGPTGWQIGKADGHGKNFGTMMHAVTRRAWKLLGLGREPKSYPRHDYAHDDDHASPPKQPPPNLPPPRKPSKPAASYPKTRKQLYYEASKHISLDSGTHYPCKQSDLDATGGLARQHYPKDTREDQAPSRKEWFAHKNHGPFTSVRQATLDVFQHNKSRSRRIGTVEQEAIGRLSKAVTAGLAGHWGPDLIIKAFCDLDTVFFLGKLRGHVCVRWLPDWSPRGHIIWGSSVFLGKGKDAIRMNADTILVRDREPFEKMFMTMLHEMCHAYGHTQVAEGDRLECQSHGKNFGTKFHAVTKRARDLLGLRLNESIGNCDFPRHKYENGEGFP